MKKMIHCQVCGIRVLKHKTLKILKMELKVCENCYEIFSKYSEFEKEITEFRKAIENLLIEFFNTVETGIQNFIRKQISTMRKREK